jgi:tRNA pseudouridine55 synthase
MARRKPPQVHGFLLIDKPAGITSQGLVGQLRKKFNERQVGHAGTLDPDATGLMLIGVGRATRLLTFLVGMDKTYEGELTFGARTDTLDAAGKVIETFDMPDFVSTDVESCITKNLTGDIMQIPPMVSAIRVEGKRLHQLAREGIEIERTPRAVTISRFDVTPTSDPRTWSFAIDCSSGTYIRSLADDLGRLMGGGAYLKTLRRTRVGPFSISSATNVEHALLSNPLDAVAHMSRVEVDDSTKARVLHGSVLDRADLFAGDGPWAVCDLAGELLAIYEPHRESTVKPAVVIAENSP